MFQLAAVFAGLVFFASCAEIEKTGKVSLVILIDQGTGPILSSAQSLCIPRSNRAICLNVEKGLSLANNSGEKNLSEEPILAVAASKNEVCSLSKESIYCWDIGESEKKRIPIEKPVNIALGLNHFCARNSQSDAYCWGNNDLGQLGSGSAKASSKPNHIKSLAGQVSKVRTGYSHSCVIDKKGQVWCYGDNRHGQLGDGTKKSRSEPVQIKNLPPIDDLALGLSHSCALSNGTSPELYCWGSNHLHQLGVKETESVLKPKLIEINATPTRIVSGASHTCLLDDQGQVWCWGANLFGQINSSKKNVIKPSKVSNANSVSLMVLSHYYSIFIHKNGSATFVGESHGISHDIESDLATFSFKF